jgi:hypothetical protein
MSVYLKLMNVQSELKAPKNQYNSFGKYAYRSCEDILEALKPVLLKHKAAVIVTDDIVFVDGRHYVKATVKFIDAETGEVVENSALAREEESKKGMDACQLTGATSSYARKYALNGLFCIDDTKDSDATNTHGKEAPTKAQTQSKQNTPSRSKVLSEGQIKALKDISAKANCSEARLTARVKAKFKCNVEDLTKEQYDFICDVLKKEAEQK